MLNNAQIGRQEGVWIYIALVVSLYDLCLAFRPHVGLTHSYGPLSSLAIRHYTLVTTGTATVPHSSQDSYSSYIQEYP